MRTAVTIEEEVLRWVKVRAARQGKGDSEVIKLSELFRVLEYRKLRSRITADEARAYIELLDRSATTSPDPQMGPSVPRIPAMTTCWLWLRVVLRSSSRATWTS